MTTAQLLLTVLFLLPLVAMAQVRGARRHSDVLDNWSRKSGKRNGESMDRSSNDAGVTPFSSNIVDTSRKMGMSSSEDTVTVGTPVGSTTTALAAAGMMGMGSSEDTVSFNIVGTPSGSTTTAPAAAGMMGMGSSEDTITTTIASLDTAMGSMGSMGMNSNSNDIDFVQSRFSDLTAVEATQKVPGTVFTFADYAIVTAPFDQLFATGSCTRVVTQTSFDTGISQCDFEYSLEDAEKSSFSVSGQVLDGPLNEAGMTGGGLLAVTGGTGQWVGANGQMTIVPFFDLVQGGDFFLDAQFYVVNATVML